MRSLLIVLLFITFSIYTPAQNKVLIRGYSDVNGLTSIQVSPPLRDCINGWVPLATINIDSVTHKFEKAITITKPTLIYLKCNNYVETYVKPGDTIDLVISKTEKPIPMFDGSFRYQINSKASLKGKHWYNNFFAALEEKTTKMDNVPYDSPVGMTDQERRYSIKDLFERRMKFLKDYIVTNAVDDKDFIRVANNEIEGQYIQKLSLSAHLNEELPDEYTADILKQQFKWNDASTSQYLMQAAIDYFIYYLDNIDGENYTAVRFSNKYNNVKNHVKDPQLRDYLLTTVVLSFLDKEPQNYKTIVDDYAKTCLTQRYVMAVLKLYAAKNMQSAGPNLLLSNSALAVNVTDVAGNTRPLSTLLQQYKNKVIFIDFWASWCMPCLIQIPYLKELENKYAKDVVFVSLSEDKTAKPWLLSIKQNQLSGNQFQLDYNNKTQLFNELKISAIPRYILIKPNGEILNVKLPKPNETENITNIINKAISKAKKQ